MVTTTKKDIPWEDKLKVSLNFLQDEDLPVKARMKILFAAVPKSKDWLLRELARVLNSPHEGHLAGYRGQLLAAEQQRDLSPEALKLLQAKQFKEHWNWKPTPSAQRDLIRTDKILESDESGVPNILIDLAQIPTLAGFGDLWAHNTNTTGFWKRLNELAQKNKRSLWPCLLHAEQTLSGSGKLKKPTGAIISVIREATSAELAGPAEPEQGTRLFTLLIRNRQEPVTVVNKVKTKKEKAAAKAKNVHDLIDELDDNVVSIDSKRGAK